MSLASCPKCWDDLCTCGWQWRGMAKQKRMEAAAAILGIPFDTLKTMDCREGIVIPVKHPDADKDT